MGLFPQVVKATLSLDQFQYKCNVIILGQNYDEIMTEQPTEIVHLYNLLAAM